MNGSYITSDRNYDSRSRKEALINSLEHCEIAQQDRIFYMENPEAWDWDKSSPLNVGVKAVLSNSNYSPPPVGRIRTAAGNVQKD